MTTTKTNEAILNPKGEREAFPLNMLEAPHALGGKGVPDLWHLAESMPEIAKLLLAIKLSHHLIDTDGLKLFLDEDDGLTFEEIGGLFEKIENYEPFMQTKGAKAQENLLAAWHLAHDLKRRSLAMAAALQPIMDLLMEAEQGVNVPVELLRAVRAIHTGEEPK